MSEMTLEVHKREVTTKNANRRLRAVGKLPAIVYGDGKEPVPIEVDRRSVIELMKKGTGENTVFLLKLAGADAKRHTMIRDLDVDPITHQIRHIDFQRVKMTEKVTVEVPVELTGLATGVKNESGVLDFVTRAVEVECLPGMIPGHLTLDVSALHVGQHLEMRHLTMPEGVVLVDDPEKVVVSVSHSRLAVAEEEEGEELLEAAQVEPELIRKGRETGEGEEAES